MKQISSLGSGVKKSLKGRGVAVVYLYGSEAVGRSNRLSDVDVGIVLRDPAGLQDRERQHRLWWELFKLLEPEIIPDDSREMDLVLLQTASSVLQFEVINSGRLLFTDDPIFQADYEASVTREYLDIRPLVEVHYEAALERIQ